MISLHSNRIHKRMVGFLLFIYVLSLVLSYTELSSGTNIFKFIFSILIVAIELAHIDLRKYIWTWPLLISLVVLPLFLSVVGIYSTSMKQVIIFIFYYVLTLLLWISLANCYFNDIGGFINVWFFSINVSMLLLFIVFRGISLNISYFVNAMISNQRYGSDLLVQRYGMGFVNVNTFGLFSSILIVCAFYQLINKRFVVLSIVDILAGVLFIFNAESRTPVFALGMMFIVWGIQHIRLVSVRKTMNVITVLVGSIFSLCFIGLLFIGSSNRLFGIIDSITSFRLSFGNLAVNNIRENLGSLFFGIGPMSTNYVTEQLFGGSISLDNSIEYFLFSVGIIGLIIIISFFIWLVFQVCKPNYQQVLFVRGLICYLVVYSFFENCIFIPGSPMSLFCVVVIFISYTRLRTN